MYLAVIHPLCWARFVVGILFSRRCQGYTLVLGFMAHVCYCPCTLAPYLYYFVLVPQQDFRFLEPDNRAFGLIPYPAHSLNTLYMLISN